MPKLSTLGVKPSITPTSATKRAIKTIEKAQDRVDRGMELVLLSAAGILQRSIIDSGVSIDGIDYAKNLKVVLLSGSGGEVSVSLVYESQEREVESTEEDGTTVFYFGVSEESKRRGHWTTVMQKYQPWPSDLLPAKISKNDTKVIARNVTQKEIQSLKARIISNRRAIEAELEKHGLDNASINLPNDNAEGMTVMDDLGFAVLRAEFGLGGKQQAHWRPAAKEMQASIRGLTSKFVEFVLTGKENLFDIPDAESGSAPENERFSDMLSGPMTPSI